MKSQAMESLLFAENGKFHSFIKKTQKSVDLKAFDALPTIQEKLNFLSKNGIEYKPVVKTVRLTKCKMKKKILFIKNNSIDFAEFGKSFGI